MEDGTDFVGEERQMEKQKQATEDGGLKPDLVNGDAGGSLETKGKLKESKENEVFEDAMDGQSFQMAHQHEQSDSQDAVAAVGGVENGEVHEKVSGEHRADKFDQPVDALAKEEEFVGSEKFQEPPKVQVGDGKPEEQAAVVSKKFHESPDVQGNDRSSVEQAALGSEKFQESTNVQVSDGTLEEQAAHSKEFLELPKPHVNEGHTEGTGLVGYEKFHESTEAQVVDQSPQALDAVGSEEKAEALKGPNGVLEEENGEGVAQSDSNGVEADSVSEKGVKEIEETFSGVVDDGERNPEDSGKKVVEEDSQNMKLEEPNLDDAHVSHLRIKSGQSVHMIDAESTHHVTDSKEQIPCEGLVENINPLQGHSNMANGIEAKTLTQAAAEVGTHHSHVANGVEETQMQTERETERESVVVENISESNSSNDKEIPTFTQPAPPVTTHPENSGGPSLRSRPAGLGSSVPLLEPAARSVQQPRANGSVSQRQPQPIEEPATDEPEENRETREKLQTIRVKFLRLAHRLGQTPHNVVVAQVLYRLGLAEQLWGNTNRSGVFSYDRASVMAEQLEAAGQDPLDFSCTIMVIGKSGVGKSATINSIFDEAMFCTDAFQLGTKKVQAIEGTVQGIKIRVIDTPGLSSSSSDQRHNEKILYSVKRFISKTPPDIVLYFDRLDMQSRDFGDVPLLRTITDIFGASIWFNAIVVLTHAASAPPDGSSGTPLSYEMFVTQRSHVVQQAIRQAAGDVRLMNPISLVENHSACRMNRAGQRVLPNGQVWKPQLLLLSFASKILAQANMLLKLQDSPPGRPFGPRARVPPLPFLLSTLLQSRPQLKLPDEQIGDEDTMDDDLDDASDSGGESEDYDELPPFKRLTKSQLAKLSRAQRKAYFEELEYREKLFFKKQLKEEKKRRKMMKKMAESAKDMPNDYNNENVEDESTGPASVPVPLPDLVLPNSFDSDYPSHRYRFLDSSSQWLVRPVLETQGWDHDVGYEGLNVERFFVVKDKIPVSVSGQLTKDKKECNLQMELGTSIKHSEGKATSLGLDVQTVGKDMAYTLHAETRFKSFRRNNIVAGLSVTHLGDAMSAGVKIEDKLIVNKRFRFLMSGGAMTGRGDVAYGGRLEATLRDKDYPIGRALSTLALSIVDWHGDLAIGYNVQSQLPLGRGTNLIGHANLSNKGSGQVGIRLNTSEHFEIVLLALFPVFRNVKRLLLGSSQSL